MKRKNALFFMIFIALWLCQNSVAQPWETHQWRILDKQKQSSPLARYHEGVLSEASRWFESMAFPPPLQIFENKSPYYTAGQKYFGELKDPPENNKIDPISSHSSLGRMYISHYIGNMNPQGPADELMSGSAVHELFHGIQHVIGDSKENFKKRKDFLDENKDSEMLGIADELRVRTKNAFSGNEKTYRNWVTSSHYNKDGLKFCGETTVGFTQWIGEGTASYVQIVWLEHKNNKRWIHPFSKESGKKPAAWVRYFDTSLDRPSLKSKMNDAPEDYSPHKKLSWQCAYGSWYFWYAIGEMITGKNQFHDPRRLTYLKPIFRQTGAWGETGIALVNKGLIEAINEFRASGVVLPTPLKQGLYYIYPRFIADYIDTDDFFESLKKVNLTGKSLYKETSDRAGQIEANGTKAWRVTVNLPPVRTQRPIPVRFWIRAGDGTNRDDLHLIVDNDIIGRPASKYAPYIHQFNFKSDDDSIKYGHRTQEYFIRVANMAKEPEKSKPANYELLIEVDGFYGQNK